MQREYSHTITEQQYNYLLPVFGNAAQGRTRLLHRHISSQKRDSYFFIGTHEDFLDMHNRCKYLNG